MSRWEATLIAYDTKRDNFSSLYERNKFYRGLFGYKQTVKENGKVYKYDKPGLLGSVPHIKVDDSVIIVADDNAQQFKDYLQEWGDKVAYKTYKVLLDKTDWAQVRPQATDR
jgi:hypothetical protein